MVIKNQTLYLNRKGINRECSKDFGGEEAWGIIRTSYRSQPNFETGSQNHEFSVLALSLFYFMQHALLFHITQTTMIPISSDILIDIVCAIFSDPFMWGDGDDGTDVDMYIVDTGIMLEHEDFEGRAEWGFTASYVGAKEPDKDLNGHGTAVAGAAAGRRLASSE